MGVSIGQFSDVFKIRDSKGKPYVLIGGQAVNYWAERYLPEEPELKHLHPFTSQDIDFKGSRDDVEHIARQLHSSPGYPWFPWLRWPGSGSTISQKIMELHSGHIRAESAGRNQGAIFTIQLPLAKGKKDPENLLSIE